MDNKRIYWVKCKNADGSIYFRDGNKPGPHLEAPIECTDDAANTSKDNDTAAEEIEEDDEEDMFTNFSEFTLADGLNFEIQSLGLFAKYRKVPSMSSKAVKEEMLPKVTFVKEQFENGVGADEDWMRAVATNDFALVEYLLRLLDDRAPSDLSKAAAQCLAFAGTVYPKLWADFIYDEDRLHEVLSKSIFLASNISAWAVTKKMRTVASVPYIGFDERDVADFGLVGLEREEETGAAEDEEVETSLLVLLMLLTQIYTHDISAVKGSWGASSFSTEEVDGMCRLPADEVLKELAAAHGEEHISTSRTLKLICAVLLLLMPSFSEDAYLLALKSICSLNRQGPKLDELNSTEICKICCVQQFDTNSQINVSEVSNLYLSSNTSFM